MIQVTDKNRDDIIERYVDALIDSMDMDTLIETTRDYLIASKDILENNVLEDEIKDYFPAVLEEFSV